MIKLWAFDSILCPPFGILPNIPIELGGVTILIDGFIILNPMDYNIILGFDYINAMDFFGSSLLGY